MFLPNVAFQDGDLPLLTFEEEFVVKNLDLIAEAIIVGASPSREETGA